MKFTRINGVVLAHDIQGLGSDKPAIVFINSLGTDRRIWDHVVADLAGEFTILTYDKRGHGLSGIGQSPYRIEDHAADLAGLLDHYGLKNVILCGLSVGGLIALGLYKARPDLIRAVVFADTAHKIGTPEFWKARIEAVEMNGIEGILEPVMSRWFTPTYRTLDNADYEGYCNMLVRQPVPGYASTCAAIRDADFTETARSIAVPALCVVGDQDGSTPPDLVRSLADLVPQAGFEVIEGAAHIPCVEQPADFIARLRRFLNTLPGA
ncbi:3-oxoadipate enol-lactonase [Rhizobium oryzicola]|uniref:3-oxoadipate enol-lactonase n=1 Tax=Rhizobium oryzicola TaxID=1232668 RepID=A0ABT8SWY8_9HYPH|nr:3-oxoadipate enol-lactonase [Rhizobium oryzicola]MDO1582974.1 3-oxoadipate enol-lactonase [Rhizobium oryzicola]